MLGRLYKTPVVRFGFAVLACLYLGALPQRARAIEIVLDYTLDEMNFNWFGGTPAGLARRAALDAAAGFLSEIITNNDWNELPTLNESFTVSDSFLSSLKDLDGNVLVGSPDSDGAGFEFTIQTTNRASVNANEYVVYVGAFAFDTSTSAHAKAGFEGSDRRNAAGIAGTEFNTWGGKIYFDLSDSWYAGADPGVDPTDDYGFQDPNKTPSSDASTDNWRWSSGAWKGFDLKSIDLSADGKLDLYSTSLHELIHALGATSSNFPEYVGVNASGDLIGEHVMGAFGGPVPADGGHFGESLQSIVWDSEDIVSEVNLDPNSLRAVRKYLTQLDAALLRDLGYEVLSSFPTGAIPGDYNGDGIVGAADYPLWRDALGASVAAAGDGADGNATRMVDAGDYDVWRSAFGHILNPAPATTAVSEPTAGVIALLGLAWVLGYCRMHRNAAELEACVSS